MEELPDGEVRTWVSALGSMPAERVAIQSLVLGGSPRTVPQDVGHVQALAGASDDLPPVVVHRATMRVIDGVHRVHACRSRGDDEIEARFFDGSDKDAFLLAVKLNVGHGLPLSLADRHAAVERIIDSHRSWSDRAIASVVGLSAKTVAMVRRRSTEENAQSSVRMCRDGRVRPLSAASGRLRASQILGARPETPLREVATEAGISLGTAYDVRKRIREGLDPVPTGSRSRSDARPSELGRDPAVGGEFASLLAQLRRLQKDPGLRYSEPGRHLLRLLGLSTMGPKEWNAMLDAVPAHWMGTLGELARSYSKGWKHIADEAERRRRSAA